MPIEDENTIAQQSCLESVKRQDFDRYLSVLYAPAVKRDALFALYAFNVELSRIPNLTKEPMVGEIRFAWWREALDDLKGGTVGGHPILEALSRVEGLDVAELQGMIEARIAELYREGPATLCDIEGLGKKTQGRVYALASCLLGWDAGEVADNAGVIHMCVGAIRALSHQAALQKQGHADAAFQVDLNEETGQLVRDLAASAQACLSDLKSSPIERMALSAFMPIIPLQDHLSHIKRMEFDVGRMDFSAGALRRQFKLMIAAVSGRL